jgi:hypothetical protein
MFAPPLFAARSPQSTQQMCGAETAVCPFDDRRPKRLQSEARGQPNVTLRFPRASRECLARQHERGPKQEHVFDQKCPLCERTKNPSTHAQLPGVVTLKLSVVMNIPIAPRLPAAERIGEIGEQSDRRSRSPRFR